MASTALVASGLLLGVASPAAADTATTNSGFVQIVVKTGAERTGTGNNDVSGLDGVHLELWTGNSNGPSSKVNDGAGTWADCYSISGQCLFEIPNGSNDNNSRYWIVQAASLAGSAAALNYSANPYLVTALDNGSFDSTRYAFRTGEIDKSRRYTSGTDFMVTSGNSRSASSGYWQNTRTNPAAQTKCGLNVALVADLSSSVNAAALTQLKNAATAFVNALSGTPSTISLYTFGTEAPAPGANNASVLNQSALNAAAMTSLKSKISLLSVPSGSYTNWDAGLWQLRDGAFDQVIVITDGNPTAYNEDTTTDGVDTRFNEIERAVFSANLLKTKGTRVVTVGVGTTFEDGENLKAISGPTLNSDYFTGSWDTLSTTLANIASGNCLGTVTVEKKIIAWNGTAATATPAGGWTINASAPAGVTLDQASAVTAAGNGAVNFKLSNVPVSGTTFTGTEVQQGSYTLVKQGTDNAVCTKNGSPAPLAVGGDATPLSFTVPVGPTDIVTCTIYNKEPQPNATVTVNKQWVVNNVAQPLNQFPTGFTADLTGTATDWGVSKQIPVGTVTVSETDVNVPAEYCDVISQKVTAFNATVVDVNVASGSYTSPSLAAGSTNTITVTNTVECTSKLKLIKSVVNNNGGSASASNWTLKYGSNGVTSGTTSDVTPGSYVLTEVGLAGSEGYAPSAVNPLVCTQGLSGTTVTIPFATTVTCTFTNDDVAPTLKLVKVVAGADGVSPTNWTLTAKDGGTTVVTGAGSTSVTTVKANTDYTLGESASGVYATQFTASAWTCVDGTTPVTVTGNVLDGLTPGQNVVCTITNTAKVSDPTITKTATPAVQNANGTWTITYTVTVTNPSPFSGITYDLSDTLAFGGSITATADASGPSAQAGDWNGVDNLVLADNTALAADSSHVYTVVATASVPNGFVGTVCPTSDGNGGFMNRALLTVGAKTFPAQACVAPSKPTFKKDAGTVTDNEDGTWTVTYTLEAKNTSGANLFYDLTDNPQAGFPSGVTIESGTVTPAVLYPGYGNTWNPVASADSVVANDLAIPAGATHTFTISLVVKVAPTVTAETLDCTVTGKGLINSATLVSGNQVITDDACVSIPTTTIVHEKTETSTTQGEDGNWTIVYDVVVKNTGNVTGVYSLTDTPHIDVTDTMTVVSATALDGVTPVVGFGATGGTLADAKSIEPGEANWQHYTVTVVVTVAAGKIGTPATLCSGPDSNGFLNTATITVAGIPTDSSDCSTPAKPDFSKQFLGADPAGANTWNVSYRLTVDNSSADAKDLFYTLTDDPGFPDEAEIEINSYTVTRDPGDTPVDWNNGDLVTDPREILAGTTETYLVVINATVLAGAPADVLECTDEKDPGFGFQNSATLTVGSDDYTRVDCGDVTESAVPEIEKDIVDGYPRQLEDGTWVIIYTLTVSSESEYDLSYDLDDELKFGDDITVNSADLTDAPDDVTPNPDWNGDDEQSIVTGATLPGGDEHVYTIEVNASVDEKAYTNDTVLCEQGETPDAGGFLNTAVLTSGNAEPDYADACDSPAQPTIDKVVDLANPPALQSDGTWLVTYLLTVDNPSDLQLTYDLSDTLGFASGLTVSDATVTSTDVTLPGDLNWNGSVNTGIVTGEPIDADDTHVYTITVKVAITDSFELTNAECTQVPEPGSGLYNNARLVSGGIDAEDDACADLPVAELTLVKEVDNSQFDGLELDGATLATESDWILSADGDADLEGKTGSGDVTSVLVPVGDYELSEASDPNVTNPMLAYYEASEWDCAADGTVTLTAGDDVTCTITNTGVPVDLKIVKTSGDATMVPTDEDSDYLYTLVVSNEGEIPVEGAVVTDVIPDFLKVDPTFLTPLVGWTGVITGADLGGFGGKLTLTKTGTFAVNESVTFVFSVHTAATLPREGDDPLGKILDIENTAIVSSGGVEKTPLDNESTNITPVKSLEVSVAAECVKDAPYANYSITPQNTDGLVDPTVVLIWWTQDDFDARDTSIDASDTAGILADGAKKVDVIPTPAGGWVSGVPVTGTQLWAGASVDLTGTGTGWPGWIKNVTGTWVLDPTSPFFSFRNSAVLEVRMNPSTASATAYPPATVGCRPPFDPPTLPLPPDLPTLAFTGATISVGAGAIGAALVGFGLLAAWFGRRKRSPKH